jgi:hypothetical protein
MDQEDDLKRGNAGLRLARPGGPDSPCRNARSCRSQLCRDQVVGARMR